MARCFPRVFCMKPRPFIRLLVDRCVMTSPETARDILGKAFIKYREVSKVTALVTFGFSTTSSPGRFSPPPKPGQSALGTRLDLAAFCDSYFQRVAM